MLSKFRDILICEDQAFCQMGIELCLKGILPNLEQIRRTSTGADAIAQVSAKNPDLALIDLGLPDMSGIEVIRQLRQIQPEIKVLVVTSSDSPIQLRQVRALKVAGIMQKASSPDHLLSILQQISEASGEQTILDPNINLMINDQEGIVLTPREYEVLERIAQGLPNAKIAEELGCALTTVRFHRSNLMQKTNIRNAAEMTAWFLTGQRNPN